MSNVIDSVANALLDSIFGAGSPATWYIGLYSDMPLDDGSGGTEITGGSYARKSTTNNATNYPNASSRQKANGVAFTFATATADWGSIVGIGFFTASSGGTPQYKADLVADRTVLNGDTFSFAIGQLVISVP